jgi:DNA-binding Lrp family transcriptional regulator
MSYRIDDIDQRIIYHLVAEARHTSAPMIAEEVDVTPATIRNRIRQLEEAGVLRGYHANVDYEATNGKLKMQFTCTAPVEDQTELADEALAVRGVVGVRELLAGRENVVVTAVGEGTDDTTRIARTLSALGLTIVREDIIREETIQPYEAFAPGAERKTAVTDFRSIAGGAGVVEFTVAESADITGQSLQAATESGLLPDETLVVSIERGENRLTPKGDTTIEAGDVVWLFSPGGLPDETLEAFEAEPVEKRG